ncbi:peptide/nickel transport system permease protein [Streptomyces sp. DvalAA-14]|uniref:ABC transporter permease n=1 Tax=unclassified Streptomyces TaxID=2593676 RepID=UPI00081BB7DC|nr:MULTISPECIES: ABC transporter permease [unclassified Streptomyces]MYS19307.1 ABC transporter permease subunit [Streptomyces sp. SID4948]SCD41598.1 peptide/nickel transport system permease protein [Streptomyces sp. DvalAA-14]
MTDVGIPGAGVPGPGQDAPRPGAAPLPGSRPRIRRQVRFWLRRPGLALSVLLVAALLLAAFFPDLLTARDPLAAAPRDKLLPPGAGHPFGTDELGRDLFARVVHGCLLTLQAAALAVGVGLVAGSLAGLIAGYRGGAVDDVLMRLTDVLLSIPGLLLSLALVTALGFGTVKVAIAVGVTSVSTFARIMRAEVMKVGRSAYVEAARACGTRWLPVLLRHVLPNAAGPVLVYAAVDFGAVILQVSSLSFLGYGARPPAPEWGSLVSDGRNYLATAWWLTTLPGLVIAATVLAANRIARSLDGEDMETR